MKRRIIIALCSIMLVLCSISVGFTVAWLTFSTTSNEVTYTVGEVKYTVGLTTAEKESDYIVPGQSIFSALTITNASNVDSNLRVRFEVIVKDKSSNSVTWTAGTSEADDEILMTGNTADNWISKTDENGKEQLNVLYYQVVTEEGTSEIITPETTNIYTAFSNVSLNGALVKNAASGYLVNLKVAIEAKQAAHVEWGQITSFETTVIVSE